MIETNSASYEGDATDDRSTDLEITVCRDGKHINVRNPRSGSGDAHTVTLADSGSVEGCTCLGYTHHGHCYHSDTVESRPIVLATAEALSNSYESVATDGGTTDGDDDSTAHATDQLRSIRKKIHNEGEWAEDFWWYDDRVDEIDEVIEMLENSS